MGQTIVPMSGMQPDVAVRQSGEVRELWHPPRSLWRLYLLSVVTSGLYLCRWAWELADDLKRNRDAEIQPWVFAWGMLVPVLNAVLASRLAGTAESININGSEPPAKQHWRQFSSVGVPLATYQLYVAAVTIFSSWNSYVLQGAIVLLLLMPLNFLSEQIQINARKASLVAPRWIETPNLLARFERIGVFIVLGLAIGASFEQLDKKIDRWRGDALEPDQAIAGASSLYTLTPPEAGWVRVGADHFYEGSDLSLYGPSEKTHVLVWIRCEGANVEDRVRFRRGKKGDAFGNMVAEEERRLLPGSLLPISHARYSGTWKGREKTSLVATVVQGEVLVEVIGTSDSVGEERAQMERMVRSLELKEGATSCDDS